VHPYLLVPRGQITARRWLTLAQRRRMTVHHRRHRQIRGCEGELHVQNVSPTEGILTFHLEH